MRRAPRRSAARPGSARLAALQSLAGVARAADAALLSGRSDLGRRRPGVRRVEGRRTIEDTNGYDFVVNTFGKPGERRDVRALNVNTVDEVPDSSWFTNRIGRRDDVVAEIVRGPGSASTASRSTAGSSSGGKGSGVQPGFRMTDPSGQLYQIEVDPPSNPELASGGRDHRHGLLPRVRLSRRRGLSGRARSRVARHRRDGDHARSAQRQAPRAAATRSGPGVRARRAAAERPAIACSSADSRRASRSATSATTARGPTIRTTSSLHEHRRELRGARVFGAWLNHDDSRGINSLDMLETTNGRAWVKHYMFDFGSILGSGTVFAQRHRAGNEYIFEQRPGWLTLATLGLYIRPWMPIDYPGRAAVGRPVRGRRLRPADVEARISEPRVRQHAAGRCVLGGAHRGEVQRRDDPRRWWRRRGTATRRPPTT